MPVSQKQHYVHIRSLCLKLVGFLSSLVVLGCTNLSATKVNDSDKGVEGQVYNLSRVEFSIGLDRELKSCQLRYKTEFLTAQEWLREQADLIASRSQLNDSQSDYNKIISDPILKRPEVRSYFDTIFNNPSWATNFTPNSSAVDQMKEAFVNVAVLQDDDIELLLEVEMRAIVTPLVLSDPSQIYVIKYGDMKESFKSTDYAVETYPNGTLKSINVVLADQTAAVVQSTLQGAARIASAVNGIPVVGGFIVQSMPNTPVSSFEDWFEKQVNKLDDLSPCSATTKLQILQKNILLKANSSFAQQILNLEKDISNQEKTVTKLTTDLSKETKKLADMADNDPARTAQDQAVKTAEKAVTAAKKILADHNSSKKSLEDSSSKLTTNLANVRKQLTLSAVTHFSPEAAVWGKIDKNKEDLEIKIPAIISIMISGAEEALDLWLDKDKVKTYCSKGASCDNERPKSALKSLSAQAAIYPSLASLSKVPPPTIKSVVYRNPLRTMLFVCKEQLCIDENGKPSAEHKNILLASVVDVPQLGVLASLPLKNSAFQNNTLTATFAESGTLTKLTYVTNATAQAAAETFTKSADVFLQYKAAKLNEEKTKLEQTKLETDAKTELLKSQLAEEQARADLIKFLQDSSTETNSNDSP